MPANSHCILRNAVELKNKSKGCSKIKKIVKTICTAMLVSVGVILTAMSAMAFEYEPVTAQVLINTNEDMDIIVDPLNGDDDTSLHINGGGAYTVTVNEPGELQYNITQKIPANKKEGKTYDETCYRLQVVTIDVNGTLKPYVAVTEMNQLTKPTEITFNNVEKETETETDPEKKFYYYIDEGDGQTWTDGDDPLKIDVKRSVNDEECYERFEALWVDGKLLVEGVDYTVEDGPCILVTFMPEFLKTLSSGEHKITVGFNDGKTDGVMHIVHGEKPTEQPTEPEQPTQPENPTEPNKPEPQTQAKPEQPTQADPEKKELPTAPAATSTAAPATGQAQPAAGNAVQTGDIYGTAAWLAIAFIAATVLAYAIYMRSRKSHNKS